MKNEYFKYRFGEDIDFNIKEGEFVSIIGDNNDLIIHTLLNGHNKANIFVGDKELNKTDIDIIRRRIGFVLYRHLNVFVGETVRDEIAFGLESLAMSKDDITSLIESKSLSSLIVSPNILVIDNIMSELDYKDKELVFDILKEYVDDGGIVINFTNDIEETMFGEKIIIIYDKKLVCEGKTLSVLNEEKILKRLGLGLPFMIELNRYLMDYGLIDKYHLSNRKLVGAIWK